MKARPGAHQALAEYAKSLSGEANEPALARFDRNRNRSEYGSRSLGDAEVKEAINTAQAIRAACSRLG